MGDDGKQEVRAFADRVIAHGVCYKEERVMLEAIAAGYFKGQFLFNVLKNQKNLKEFEPSWLAQQFAQVGIEIKPPHGLKRNQVESHSLRGRGPGRPKDWGMKGFIWRTADLWEYRGEHAGTSEGQCPDSPFQRFLGSLLLLLDPGRAMPSRKKIRNVLKRRKSQTQG